MAKDTNKPDSPQTAEQRREAVDFSLLRFAIEPQLPANVHMNEQSGVITGSPFREHVGCQYTVMVRWADTGKVAGCCALAFAVVSADLASLCNNAYLGQEPPCL
jgi:hypothetical protein